MVVGGSVKPRLVTTTCNLGDKTLAVFELVKGFLYSNFDGMTVIAAPETDPATRTYLESTRAAVVDMEADPPAYAAFREAAKHDGRVLYVQYICRLLNWAQENPQELRTVSALSTTPTIIERSPNAMERYSNTLAFGERMTNKMTASIIRSRVPWCNGKHVDSGRDYFGRALLSDKDGFEYLLVNIPQPQNNPHADSLVWGRAVGLLLFNNITPPEFEAVGGLFPLPGGHDVNGDVRDIANQLRAFSQGINDVISTEEATPREISAPAS